MKVHQARWFAVTLLVIGGMLTLLRLWLLMETGRLDVSALLAPLLMALGILALLNPTLVYEGGELRLCNLLGMTLRRYPLAALTIEAGGQRRTLRADLGGGRSRRLLAVPSLLHDRAEAAAMIDRIAADKRGA